MSSRGPASISAAQLSSWNKDGFLVIPDALNSEQVGTLLQEAKTMIADLSLDDHPMTKFSTGESVAHVGDDYFLTSGDKIRFFFEEGAFSEAGQLTKPKEKAINKIGHCLHELSEPFRSATFSTLHSSIARTFGYRDPRVLQSMVICKQPEIGGKVPPHQDSSFLYTDPPSAVGFWIALEDATIDNGCLSFAAGSHKCAPLKSRFVRLETEGTGFVDCSGSPWPESFTAQEEDGSSDWTYQAAPVKAGSLVLIHGNLLHKSEANLSKHSRFIYTFHMIEGDTHTHVYDYKNWLQPPSQGFSKLY